MTEQRRRVWAEIAINAGAIVLIPLLAGPVLAQLNRPLRDLGFGSLLDVLAGRQFPSDIGIEVASAVGLVSRDHHAFDPVAVLGPLIGMGGIQEMPHTHPPTSIILWLPLAPLPYAVWLPMFAVLSISVIAASMRVLDVPAWVAYPVALGIGLHPDWLFALVSTYPLTALGLALAWRYRDRQVGAGLVYGLLTAARGFAGLLVLYPLVRRQWRAVGTAIGVVAALLLVAFALEPGSIRDFLVQGSAAISETLQRTDLFTLDGYLARHGIPTSLAAIPAIVIAVLALLRRCDLFWVLAWLSVAVSSIAWMQTTVVLIPICVVIYRAGVVGRVLVLLGIGLVLGPLSAGVVSLNVIWPVAALITGIALVASPVRLDAGVWPARRAAAST